MNRRVCTLFFACVLLMAGCAHQPDNPSFPTRISAAQEDLDRMEAHPQHLHRPLVVIGGFLDPGIAAYWESQKFSELTGDDQIVAVALGDCLSFADCRKKIVDIVNSVYPKHPSDRTVDVDVVGYSLGGVAARYAASEQGKSPRLSISRLFTISSPNNGAVAADRLPLLHPMQGDLRHGSKFLTSLNQIKPAYPVYAYVCLGDGIVGQQYAAMPGQTPWWIPDAPLATPHAGAFYDPRIIDDIARRLRDEPALTLSPPAALPKGS